MSVLGTRVLRTEDPKLLTVGGTYVNDLTDPRLDGAVHLAYVRSTQARARITSIDTSEAAGMPGVLAIYTGSDIELAPAAPNPPLNKEMLRPWLATEEVRYVGEPVALVVTEHADQGEDAAEMVMVDYEPITPVLDPEASATNAEIIDRDAGTNVVFNIPVEADPAFFDGCEVEVTGRIINQRLAPAPMGVSVAAATWEDGRLIQFSDNQGAHGTRDGLAKAFGIEKDQVRVITPDVGGGFGAKNGLYPVEVLTAWVSKQLGRPARFLENRSENMVGMGHGRGQTQTCTLAGNRDGTILKYRMNVIQDGGGYPMVGSILPFMTSLMASGVYAIPEIEYSATSVLTNTTPTTAYRGAGRPEAAAAIERMVDLFAAEIGMDPADVRRKNFIQSDAFPFKTAMGSVYDSGDYDSALDKALAAADYPALRAEQAERRANGDSVQLGIGLSVYVEITNPVRGSEYGSIEIQPGGKALVRTGTSPHGQGHYTSFAMIASDLTGIPLDDIEVTHGDTDDVPRGGGTGGSKSLQLGGTAITMASEPLIDRARELAASLLEANVDDITLDVANGSFHVQGTPAIAKSWAEIYDAAAAESGDDTMALFAEADFKPEGSAFPFGAHVAVTEVDTETGHVTLRDMFACDDCGKIINPLLVDGQVHGGLAQGISQAMYEEFIYDEAGNPLTGNLADYSFPAASEFPMFTRVEMETPTHLNVLGAKGIGESGTIGATPAVQNSVVDAVSHLGVKHIDMPLTPQRIWDAISSAAARQ